MYNEISQLLMYGDIDENGILFQVGRVFEIFDSGQYNKIELVRNIKKQIKNLLILATDQGFDDNLWHNYISYFLMTNENPFSMVCEKNIISDGTVISLVKNDMSLIRVIFNYDFSEIEKELNIDCFSVISKYKAVPKSKFMYNKNVREKVRDLSKQLEMAKNDMEFYNVVTEFYKNTGVGMFGLNKAFRICDNVNGRFDFKAINNMDNVRLDDLIGYELQKKELIDNTRAFVNGKKANNVLLYGDSGTGKSTSIKAIVNQFYEQGLRMIEIYKHQFKSLSDIISAIKNRNYKFIIYMDDLSFEEHEIEYKFLKAVIEGGVETKPENILIYATSNRRHLIKETWADRNDQTNEQDIHHSDTVEEKLSLVNRFGITINYSKPMQKEYVKIVTELAKRSGVKMPEDKLILEAKRWEMRHGGLSGRTAQQFINYVLYKNDEI